ncbi:short-chain dehydrogenase/reductase [Halobacillus andaensis]|uniref:Short-chain dehydrogenase/reductase n=1 Tax=Halobacillus andaensis TaxID=1176239 RepID=A0A917EVW3_HALAA|nr:SDR family oxidoreductase [Halobacillus andaensis]MBP2003730.1 NAD(P)-dependent dehydrogenase (short-subunit alcohol dehydrogenase family) [Halobacillus andaensis]GGF12776.1 short-chain dehydrogenase/reductase [Halobacillus andaensis]
MKPTVIITGASSGFGYHTAIKCAEKNMNVIATIRNPNKMNVFKQAKLHETVAENITVWPLDVTDDDSLIFFQRQVNQLKRVDVLVNNAGYAVGGFLEQVPLKDYRRQFETNVFGVIQVIQVVLPKMRHQKNGKILNVSSISGLIGFPGLSAYVSSKHALEGLSESLRFEVKPFGIDVALIEPGSYETNIWSTGLDLPQAVYDPNSPYHEYTKGLWKALNREVHEDPGKVAGLMASLADRSGLKKLRYPIGPGVRMNLLLKRILPWSVLERTVLKKIIGKKELV